ncbi:MAG: HesA/MoeB/ThiF family protein [Candidatus Bathyarchaeia archaeon]
MSENKNFDLSQAEIEYYSRQIVLPDIGYSGQIKLKKGSICIVGLGGLGSPIAIQLAAMGVGHLRLVDHDVVEASNLQRQHIYSIKYLGYPKVEAAAIRLKELNPNIEVEPLPLSLNHRNIDEIIKGVDVVVDGLDRMSTRYIINRACQKIGVPYIYGAAIMTFGSASTIIPGETPCLECFQGEVDDSLLPSCAVVGVHPSILNIIASIEVSEAVKIITGKKPLLTGKLLYCDIGEMAFDIINVLKSDKCPICSLKQAIIKPVEEKIVSELCGREGKRVFLITPKKNLNIDMNKLALLIAGFKNFNIRVKANLGITFTDSDNNRVISILKSGIMVVDNFNSEEEAYAFYKRILVDGLGISIINIES